MEICKKHPVTVSGSITNLRKIGLLMFAFVFIFVNGITMSVNGSIYTMYEVGEINNPVLDTPQDVTVVATDPIERETNLEGISVD